MLEIAYDLNDEVRIIPLERDGFVTAVLYDSLGLRYQVRYFDNAEAKFDYFYKCELIERQKKDSSRF